jgi:type III restriction enzyme
MKFQFKVQQFQTDAVDAVADVFAGQPLNKGLTYAIDPGRLAATQATLDVAADPKAGLRNAEIALTPTQVLDGIKAVQKAQNLTPSVALVQSKAATRRTSTSRWRRGRGKPMSTSRQ